MEVTNKLKMKKLNQGITLVSLVITIIVLIILAGISINLTLGEEGIFTLAQKARENMELAQIEEQEKLNTLYTEFDFNTEGEGEIGDIVDAIDKLSDFKKAIAQAIQDAGGIPPEDPLTAQTETFQEKIKELTDGTATKEDILLGKTAWAQHTKLTGTNKGIDSIKNMLFGGTSQEKSIPCETSTKANVSVGSSDPLWTQRSQNYTGKSDPIYLLKDPDGNLAIANTITISYTCGASQAYNQETSYGQTIYLKDEEGNILDTITKKNGSTTWNLFTLKISGSYVYIEYTLSARVRLTTYNPDMNARAYATMTTPSVIYLYEQKDD